MLARPCCHAFPVDKRHPDCLGVGDVVVWNMTCYPNEPTKFWMCSPCAEDYVSFWQEQWDEYYSSQGVGSYSGVERTFHTFEEWPPHGGDIREIVADVFGFRETLGSL